MHEEFTWRKSIVLTIGAMTLRGWNPTPKKTSARIAFIAYVLTDKVIFFLLISLLFRIMMTGFILYLLWEAKLISNLSKRTIQLPFTDLASLLSTSNYKIGLMVGSSQENSFRYSEDPLFQRAWTERIEPYLQKYKNYKSGGDKDHVPLSRIPIDFVDTALYHTYSSTM